MKSTALDLGKVDFYKIVLFRFRNFVVNRKRPIVRFSEEDRVEYKGWLGMIRELQEDRNLGYLAYFFCFLASDC